MPASTPQEVRRLLSDLTNGNQEAVHELIPVMYRELRALADRLFRRQPAGHTLQPSAVVHEAWLRLADRDIVPEGGRSHFMHLAAQVMRQILTDHARRRGTAKRGGDWRRVSLGHVGPPSSAYEVDLVDLEYALDDLEAIDERQARIVEMRFLAGMTIDEASAALGVSTRTVELDWRMARAWLRQRLGSGGDP